MISSRFGQTPQFTSKMKIYCSLSFTVYSSQILPRYLLPYCTEPESLAAPMAEGRGDIFIQNLYIYFRELESFFPTKLDQYYWNQELSANSSTDKNYRNHG